MYSLVSKLDWNTETVNCALATYSVLRCTFLFYKQKLSKKSHFCFWLIFRCLDTRSYISDQQGRYSNVLIIVGFYSSGRSWKHLEALFIFQLVGLAIAGLGVFFILDNERAQLHQLVLLTLAAPNPGDKAQDPQPMLYYLTLALIGSGLAMTLVALFNLLAASKENQPLLFIVST